MRWRCVDDTDSPCNCKRRNKCNHVVQRAHFQTIRKTELWQRGDVDAVTYPLHWGTDVAALLDLIRCKYCCLPVLRTIPEKVSHVTWRESSQRGGWDFTALNKPHHKRPTLQTTPYVWCPLNVMPFGQVEPVLLWAGGHPGDDLTVL